MAIVSFKEKAYSCVYKQTKEVKFPNKCILLWLLLSMFGIPIHNRCGSQKGSTLEGGIATNKVWRLQGAYNRHVYVFFVLSAKIRELPKCATLSMKYIVWFATLWNMPFIVVISTAKPVTLTHF